jgi:3-methyl-2-oxobutanoate hydroxymethyltransferase
MARIGIPVMGHIGLTPQSIHSLGGYRVQGREQQQAEKLLSDAQALAEAGCFALVLECVPKELAAEITTRLPIPTIGIGAGPDCDGQVLVLYDLLGMNEEFRPRFVKRYDNLAMRVRTAIDTYISEVRDGDFPAPEHTFGRDKEPRQPAASAGSPRIAAAGGVVSEIPRPGCPVCRCTRCPAASARRKAHADPRH